MEHTHHDRKQKMQFALQPLASGIKMTILLPAPRLRSSSQRYHLSPVISGQLHSSHATIMAWGQLQEVGKHTLVDQTRLCVRCLRLCTRIRDPRTSITDILRKQLFQLSNKSLVFHQPTLCALRVLLGHLDKLPTAFSEVPNKGKQIQKWLPHPCLLRGPKEGGNATSPLHSRGPQQRGTKSEVATSPLPSRGPKRGRKRYVTLAFSGIPNRGEQNQKWLPHPLFFFWL